MSGDQVFVDTNILVYAYDQQGGERSSVARALVADLWRRRGSRVISAQVLQEFYVTLVRKGTDGALARGIVSRYSHWEIVRTDWPLILEAIDASVRWQISFWDALIIEAARRAGVRTVWSEDLNAGQDYGGVVVVNPLRAKPAT